MDRLGCVVHRRELADQHLVIRRPLRRIGAADAGARLRQQLVRDERGVVPQSRKDRIAHQRQAAGGSLLGQVSGGAQHGAMERAGCRVGSQCALHIVDRRVEGQLRLMDAKRLARAQALLYPGQACRDAGQPRQPGFRVLLREQRHRIGQVAQDELRAQREKRWPQMAMGLDHFAHQLEFMPQQQESGALRRRQAVGVDRGQLVEETQRLDCPSLVVRRRLTHELIADGLSGKQRDGGTFFAHEIPVTVRDAGKGFGCCVIHGRLSLTGLNRVASASVCARPPAS